MELNIKRTYYYWIICSIILIAEFFAGVFTTLNGLSTTSIFPLVSFISLIVLQILIGFKILEIKNSFRNKFGITIMLILNLSFSYIIGFTIPLLESISRYNFGIVMIPLLLILHYILLDKNEKDNTKIESETLQLNDKKIENLGKKRPIIEFENKKFIFSNSSLIILAIGAPLLAYLIYFFFDAQFNYWLHEIVVKQTVYFLNLLFNMGASSNYYPIERYHWSFVIPEHSSIYFETFCTGIQAICVFAGIIICTPHSKDAKTKRDIIWRKTKALIVSSVIFYVVNIIRMLIQIYLYYLGYPWESIHVSISAASSFIAAIIILLLHKWIPEFIISIIYAGTVIKEKFKTLKSKEEDH